MIIVMNELVIDTLHVELLIFCDIARERELQVVLLILCDIWKGARTTSLEDSFSLVCLIKLQPVS